MNQAKQHGGAHRCGDCARTVRVRHEIGKVACVPHLEIMSMDRTSDCEDYRPVATSSAASAPQTVLPST